MKDNLDKNFEKRTKKFNKLKLNDFLIKRVELPKGRFLKIPVGQAIEKKKHENSGSESDNSSFNSGSDSDSEIEEINNSTANLLGWKNLYPYQHDGIKFLWNSYHKQLGCILGDEMGLGKTVQIINFLMSLYFTNLKLPKSRYRGLGPSLIVCPVTLLYQWQAEFQKWFPLAKVYVYNSLQSHHEHDMFKFLRKQAELNRDLEFKDNMKMITPVIVITNYQKLIYKSESRLDKYRPTTSSNRLVEFPWHYVVLDEGHKIKNPESQVTIEAKKLKTPNRIILSGTPIQNNLKELWCLFDFCYPSLLGTLPVFNEEIVYPIQMGGYSTANDLQVNLAYKCASTLKETISPYILQRTKKEVNHTLQLPDKKDQILFCNLTDHQVRYYKEFHRTAEYIKIIKGEIISFSGLHKLRNICNHPDFYKKKSTMVDYDPFIDPNYGSIEKSGKLIVLKKLLELWFNTKKIRCLIFTQSVEIKKIIETILIPELENEINDQRYIKFLSIDGKTASSKRLEIINEFNNNNKYFCLIATTKTGGLGVNLTGANRVVIFDPDWNPSTDNQAQERSWRIGQKNNVIVYRLLTAGTIEEKMYHKQIQKQFLSTKVLKDPKQKRLFTSTSMRDLLSLGKQYTVEKEQYSKFAPKIESSRLLESTKAEKAKPDSLQAAIASARMKLENKLEEKYEKIRQEVIEEEKEKESNKNATKKKKSSKNYLEGEVIPNLAKKKKYEFQAESFNDQDILTVILKNNNVKTCFDHNKVLKNSSEADYILIENEANNKAKKAFEKIRKSAKESCLKNIPTFTGLGENNQVSEAANLIKAIKARNLKSNPNSKEEIFMKKCMKYLEDFEKKDEVCSADDLCQQINSWKLNVDLNYQMACLNLIAVQDTEDNWYLRKKKKKVDLFDDPIEELIDLDEDEEGGENKSEKSDCKVKKEFKSKKRKREPEKDFNLNFLRRWVLEEDDTRIILFVKR